MQSQVWPRKQACFCQGVQDDPRPAHPAATSTPHLRMSPSRFPQPSPHGFPVAALVVPLSPLWGTSAVGPLECPCASPPRGLCEGQPGAWEAQPCSACRFPPPLAQRKLCGSGAVSVLSLLGHGRLSFRGPPCPSGSSHSVFSKQTQKPAAHRAVRSHGRHETRFNVSSRARPV